MPNLFSFCLKRHATDRKVAADVIQSLPQKVAHKLFPKAFYEIVAGFFQTATFTTLSQFGFCAATATTARGKSMLSFRKSRSATGRVNLAFTLIELLAVIAIMGIMLALLAPAVGSFNGSAGRKGAVNIIMNTLEQARAAALEQNCAVSVLFWRRDFPQRDALMVVRDPSPWIIDEKGQAETKVVPLTKWIQLPQGILLHKPTAGTNIFNNSALNAMSRSDLDELPQIGGHLPTESYLAAVKFSRSGAIVSPATSADARVIITEGVRGTGGTEAVLPQKGQTAPGGGFDIITLSRFTGRPRLDVTTL